MESEPASGRNAAERLASMSRRHFLRGVGACVALPALPSLMPGWSRAAEVASRGAAEVASRAPLRMAFITIPNGVNLDRWRPKGEGKQFQLASTMEPLAAVKDQIQLISGLDHLNATAGRDGAGDHARAAASLLTGCRAKKTAGADIRVGPSIDQVAAQHVGHLTRFASLELTCDNARNSGNCDSGYSCAYQHNISWRTATTPAPPERNPRRVFERLFGAGSSEEGRRSLERRIAENRSILDFVRDDARSLGRKLNPQSRQKLDEYLTSIRDVEERIGRIKQLGALPRPEYKLPDGIPDHFSERMRVMYDMLALAFQTDSTRIATLIIGADGMNRAYPEIGIPQGHHDLSHHAGNAEKLEKIAKIDRHHMEHFGKFVEKLAAMHDADGSSILHNSMIVYVSGLGDGNAHNHTNLPLVLVGSGGGKLQTGRLHDAGSMPMSNMYLEMLEHLGIHGVTHFGDADNRRVAI